MTSPYPTNQDIKLEKNLLVEHNIQWIEFGQQTSSADRMITQFENALDTLNQRNYALTDLERYFFNKATETVHLSFSNHQHLQQLITEINQRNQQLPVNIDKFNFRIDWANQ